MSKLTGKFTTVPWAVNGKSGYWLRFLPGDAIKDESFLREVIYRAGLNYTAEELLHAFRAVAKYGPILASEDGRSRIVTGFIEFLVRLSGSVDSPDGAFNPAIHQCIVKAKLRHEAIRKVLDVSMTNITSGIGVNLDNVTYLGATGVQNIIKPVINFAAYGDHMEMLEGDTATITYGDTVYPLTCVSSDVSKAEFTFPSALASVPQGAQLQFEMHSRGGVAEGQVYTNRKNLVMDAYAGDVPLITAFNQGDLEEGTFHCSASEWVTLKGAGFRSLNIQSLKVGHRSGNTYDKQINATEVSIVDDNTMRFKLPANTSTMTDEELREADLSVTLYTQSAISAAYSLTYVG